MVICIIALIVFGIASIWSAKYRQLAKDAFECVFRTVTLRTCVTKLDEKIKSKITAKLMRVPSLARFFYKNFKILSWLFTIIFFSSMVYSVYGIYNLIVYGSCDPSSPSTCVINQGIRPILQLINCYQTHQIIYLTVIIVIILIVVIVLAAKYLRIKIR